MSLSCFLLILCFSASAGTVSAVNGDGKALLSLVRQWKIVPSSVLLSWNDSDPNPCSWVGVKCEQNNQSVVALRLSSYGILGQLGSEISYLKHLNLIDLSRNSFSGSIPFQLGNCSFLESLDLSSNRFSGEIPASVTNLRNLSYINLSNNSLTGEIPKELGINSCLVQVDFSHNHFTGQTPPQLCFRNHLSVLNLGQNQFQGTIPTDLGRCSNLKNLILGGNKLSGAIPDFVENANLLFMDLSNNSFNGSIPLSTGSLTNVISVDLSMNMLSGAIPSELGKLVDLQNLNLSHNSFNGELPSQLSNCTRLLHLDASHNLLNGSIPSSFKSLKELSTLTLSENGLTGNIPNFLFEFRKLSKLQLGGNLLSGNIPTTIGSLGAVQNLMLLNLSSNLLTGEVPIQLRRLIMLEQIDISCNNLSGTLRFLHDIQSLVFINVSHNHFSGPIPSTLVKFSNTSFAGNSGLFVNCLALNCIPDNNSKSTTYKRSKKKRHPKTKIVLIALGSSLSLGYLLIILTIFFFDKLLTIFTKILQKGKMYRRPKNIYRVDSLLLRDVVCLHSDILKATDNLNDKYIVGKGGQGTIYKVTLSPDTVFVAKKHQFGGISSGSRSMAREIQTIGKIRHRNLIRFLGSWSGKNYGLTLYAYIENGSLHDILHEQNPRIPLHWNTRFKIALGTAHGLSYLHYDCCPPILHRDIKPKNILLDHNYEPCISNFGLSVLLKSNAAVASTPMLIGTAGYIAPGKNYV